MLRARPLSEQGRADSPAGAILDGDPRRANARHRSLFRTKYALLSPGRLTITKLAS
jgi:hypothetical protein